MSKQVYVRRDWYDCSFIQQCNDEDKFLVVYEHNGIPNSFYANSSVLRDKPVDKPNSIDSIDWEKPLQIKCEGRRFWEEVWADVVFHKRYGDVIALIFEKEGEPVYITENVKDFNLTVRNKPPILKFEKWIVYSKDGIAHVCGAEYEAEKRLLHFKNGGHFIKHIKVEWEL